MAWPALLSTVIQQLQQVLKPKYSLLRAPYQFQNCPAITRAIYNQCMSHSTIIHTVHAVGNNSIIQLSFPFPQKHIQILIFMVPCIIILNLIKTSLMHSSSVLLHLNLLYMFRMQIASILRSINMYIQVVQESAL